MRVERLDHVGIVAAVCQENGLAGYLVEEIGLFKPGGLPACFWWLLVAVIVVAVEHIGYAIQKVFKGNVEIAEMKWE